MEGITLLILIMHFIGQIFALSDLHILEIVKDNPIQKRQNLEINRCVDKAPSFCHSRVENSVCNSEKNECFCKKGFVIIRERNKIICKPLLTDLPCRVDRDCVHVSGSMCHPGAGQCVCPSRHVFVAQLFLCRKKYELTLRDDGFCKLCRENSGECFLYDPKDTRIYGYKARETVGCSCGGNRALVAMEAQTTLNICSARLVDIGQACNDRDLLCKSQKAVCTKVLNYLDKCQCMEGHVPIYQTMLQYYECFPIFDERSAPKQCVKCHSTGGKCYDTTNTNKPDGCFCSGSLSNVENGLASLTDPCSINHLTTDVQDGKIRICFQPYTFPPFETLKFQLRANKAAMFISHPNSQIYSSNHFVFKRKQIQIHSQVINDKTYFCGLLDYTDKTQVVMAKQIQSNMIQYDGILEIVRDTMKHDSVVDISFPFKFEKEGNLFDQTNIFNENNKSRVHESLQLELRVFDATKNREIVKIGLNHPLVLDITLIDSTGFYTDLVIDHCFVSNVSTNDFYSTSILSTFVYQRCNNSTKIYVFWKQISPGIHYQTSPIYLSKIYSSQEDVFIHCQISLCTNQQSCQYKDCHQKSPNDPQTRSLYRHAKISLLEKPEESLEKIYGVKENNCPYSLCLNQLQAVMTSVLLLLLLLLVVILLLILFKRQRMLQKFSVAKMNIPSTLNSYKASSDFMTGNNQNFYLLTDNNSVTNSNDNFDISEMTLPVRDTSLSNTFHLRTESLERVGNQFMHPHYHRPVPVYDSNQVMITSFQTLPCSKVKLPDISATHNPTISVVDSLASTENVQKMNNLEHHKPNNKNTNIRCSEMICMCNE